MKRLFYCVLVALALTACVPTPPPPAPQRATPTPGLSVAHHIDLVVMPDAGAAWLLDRIAHARTRVLMKMYLLTDTRFIDALQTAQRNGAQVRVMLEPTPFGAIALAKKAFEQVKAAGLDVREANSEFRLTHEKSFVIDNTAVILTANMTRSAFSRNREFAAIIDDPAHVNEIAKSFDADWNRTTFASVLPSLVWSPINSRSRIKALIASAQSSLTIYALSVADDDLITAIADDAKRGVKVRLIASPPSNTDGEDSDTVGLDKLQRAGAQVRLMTSPFIHAKIFVADERVAFSGSVNMSGASLDYNRELGILFDDASAITKLMQTFEKDWGKAVER